MSEENLKLWNSVQMTDPAFTKQFTRGGGFKGTATNATWLAKRATEMFGPIGIGWGVNVINEDYVEASPGSKVHVLRARLWYVLDGKRGEVEAYGQTEFCGKRNNGNLFVDEEAPKKSLTDATTKALAQLGFAADIHMGLFDDNKYVNEAKREFDPRNKPARNDNVRDEGGNDNGGDAGGEAGGDVSDLEKTLMAKIDALTTKKAVLEFMTSSDTQKSLQKLSEERDEAVRAHARVKLKGFAGASKSADDSAA